MCGEINRFFIIKQVKEASTLLCSVVKHYGSGKGLRRKEKGKGEYI